MTDDVELAVTELAANVVRHVGEGKPAALILELNDDQLRVELHDTSSHEPDIKLTQDQEDESGRGLFLISQISAAWGTQLTDAGKAVWCELTVTQQRNHAQVRRAAALLESYQAAELAGVGTATADVLLRRRATDMIADVLHWFAAQGSDPDDALDRAQVRYEAEARLTTANTMRWICPDYRV